MWRGVKESVLMVSGGVSVVGKCLGVVWGVCGGWGVCEGVWGCQGSLEGLWGVSGGGLRSCEMGLGGFGGTGRSLGGVWGVWEGSGVLPKIPH